jgi:hypothetical protein
MVSELGPRSEKASKSTICQTLWRLFWETSYAQVVSGLFFIELLVDKFYC